MTDPLADIRRLLPVLEMGFQSEQLRMAKLGHRIEALKAQLRDLDRAPNAPGELTPAARAGADIRWQAWVEERKKLINSEMALALRDREAIKGDMAAALAKLEAARQIEAKAALDEQRTKARRSSW